MLNQSNYSVAITRYDGSTGAVQKGIESIDGFEGLSSSDNILIKPNTLWGGRGIKNIPKYGVFTTSRVVEDIIIFLREMGCRKISIGEGCVANDELGSNTLRGFAQSGLKRVAQKYEVRLIDFNENDYVKIKLGENSIEIARDALETDFLIDVPVLKTHALTKVSLGMKNLKGCLSMKSKKAFHMLDLNEMIALLNTVIKPKLTIIDGIYALEKGPGTWGRAHRLNLIISGKDVLSVDMAGAAVLGIAPETVRYFERFAQINERGVEIDSIHMVGEKIQDVCRPLEWRLDAEEFFRAAGIEGITMQFPGDRFCTNCVTCADLLLHCYCKDNRGMSVEPVELCFGAEVKAKEDSRKVILIGDCAIRANKSNVDAIRVKGCPPRAADALVKVINHTLPAKRARRVLTSRFLKGALIRLGIYNEHFPREFAYKAPDFDPRHFR